MSSQATPSQGALRRQLSLWDAIVLAIGSIAGSGLLFLPSLTYAAAGAAVLWAWVGALVLSLPMLLMFTDVVRDDSGGAGIEAFIARGLGTRVASTVPAIFLAIVAVGAPAGSHIAGAYAAALVDNPPLLSTALAFSIIVVAVGSNLAGASVSARLGGAIVWLLLAVLVGLFLLVVPKIHAIPPVVANEHDLAGLGTGVVLAFWAFAGFENLTFIAGELKRPVRDLGIAMIVALTTYGGLAIALTLEIEALVPRSQLERLTGLRQLAQIADHSGIGVDLVAVAAVGILVINMISWVWGMSRLVYRAAGKGQLPSQLHLLNGRGTPVRGIVLVGILYAPMLGYFALDKDAISSALTFASGGFLLLYALCALSYLRLASSWPRRLAATAMLGVVGATAAGSGTAMLPGCVVAVAAYAAQMRRRREVTPSPTVGTQSAPPGGV
jgi:amino acid efflux transporter